MATLIQSKQIQGIVTASVIEGDFRVTQGSVDLTTANGVTGSFSGSFIGDGTGLTINYSQLQGKPTFVAGTGIAITQVGDDITITNTGGGGGVSGSAELLNSVALLNAYTASNDIIISGINQTTASLQSQIDALVSATSSYITTDNTGSDSQTLSIVGDQLTISGGNTITIPTGSGSGTSDFTQLTNVPSGLVSGSSQVDITQTSGYNTFSSSIATTIDNIQHTQIPSGTISSSAQIESVIDDTYISASAAKSGFGSAGSSGADWNTNLQNIPSGLVSSSEQITLAGVDGFSSYFISVNNAQNAQDARLLSLESFTGSLDSTYATDSEVSSLSASFATTIDNIQHTQIPSGVISGSTFTDFSSSVETRLSTLENKTDLTGSDSQTLSIVGDQLTISGGNTISLPSGSGGTSDFTQLTNVPSGLVSSSAQTIANLGGSGILSGSHTDITSLNQFTQSAEQRLTDLESFSSSLDATFATDSELSSLSSSIATTIDNIQHTQIPSGTVSGSSQVDFTQISNVPSGLVSSSTQITDGSGIVSGSVLRTLDGTNVLSGSILPGTNVTIDSSSGDYVISSLGGGSVPSGTISSSQQISDLGFVTSSNEAPFNGDRVVSNTLLGDLYTSGYNAGTTGSLAQFIEQVFFPTTAPTATFTNQSAKFNTNLATNNTNLVSVSLTDTVDNSPYTLVLSGTNASSLTAVPTNAESSSWEIRANGNLSAGTYSYDVTVGDSTNAERTYSGRSITIAQATSGTLSTNGTLYVIESATSGVITLSSSGIPGSTGAVSVSYSPNYGSQVATNFTSSNPLIAVNSTNGQLSLGSSISGSGNLAGSTITSTISFEDQYGNQGSGDISVNVTQNNAPNVSSTLVTNNNTNQATGSSQVLRLTITDTEGDTIPNSGLSFGGYNTTYFTPTISTPYMYLNVNNTSVPAGTYPYTASLTDIHGFRTREVNGTFTVSAADNGTLSGDSSIYIVESAVSGDSFRDATGYNNGNLANISVSYSPNYGSQVATLSSSNPAIVVDGSGNLTLGVDLSGSVTQSGDSFTSLISWTDQYGNSDSSTITATVFGNQSPSVTFTDNGLTSATAINGANIGSLSITDTESNSPFQVTIGGTDGSKFNLVPQNAASSSWEVQPNQSLTIGTYSVQFTVVDSYGEQSILNETISVTADADYGKVYVYTSTRTAAGTLSPANYLGVQGGSTVDSSTPPLVTTYTADTASPFLKIKEGSLGNSSIAVTGGTLTLRNTVSGSNLDTIVSSSFSGDGATAEMVMVVFPSGSDMVGTPTSMTDTLGGSTSGEYVMYLKAAGESEYNAVATTIHGIELDSAHEGYSTWYVIGRTDVNTASSYEIRIIPSSGSAPA